VSTSPIHPQTGVDRLSGRAGVRCYALRGDLLEAIDITMLNVALPAIRADLGLSTGMLSGVVRRTCRLRRVHALGGRWRTCSAGAGCPARAAVFPGVLRGGRLLGGGVDAARRRFVKGVAAAFMTPAGLSIITTGLRKGPQRNRALLV